MKKQQRGLTLRYLPLSLFQRRVGVLRYYALTLAEEVRKEIRKRRRLWSAEIQMNRCSKQIGTYTDLATGTEERKDEKQLLILQSI